jgi:hypothetical protein
LRIRHKLKKCLFIAYFYPPTPTVGSLRPSLLSKYLPEFGWEPVILTAKLPGRLHDGMRIIETDYKDILASIKSLFGFDQEKGLHEQLNILVSKDGSPIAWKSKLIELAKEFIAFPDCQKGWYKYAMQAARELLDKEKVDAILSTSSPVSSHIIARELKKEYHMPWVADLRDLWTQNHFYSKFSCIRYFEKQLELKTLRYADSLVTVSPGFADKLQLLHKNKKIYCITNGYDTDDFVEAQTELTKRFTMTYTGMLYGGKRDPSLLFEALSALIKENKIDRELAEVRFYGPQEDWLTDAIRKYNMDGIVKLYGDVSHEKALEKQKESQLLLLLLDKKDHEKDVYPAKIFEYFGARRSVIAFGGSGGEVKKLLEKTKAGEFAVDLTALKSILCKYYQQYITSGSVSFDGNSIIENYTYKRIAKKYSDILDKIATKKFALDRTEYPTSK